MLLGARPTDEHCAFLPCTLHTHLHFALAPCIAVPPTARSRTAQVARLGWPTWGRGTAGEVFCPFPGQRFPSLQNGGGIDRGKGTDGGHNPAPSEHSLDVSPRKKKGYEEGRQRCVLCSLRGGWGIHGWMSW